MSGTRPVPGVCREFEEKLSRTRFYAALAVAISLCVPVLTLKSGLAGQGGTLNPHAAHARFHFADPEMDFVFGSLILGAAGNGGCEIGEAFAAAGAISDGDAQSWQREWARLAGLVAERGERSLAAGHEVSARDQFLRASYYYRAALVSMLPDDPRFKDFAGKSRGLLTRAGLLMQPRLEYVEIPFGGVLLPGYFRKSLSTAAPVKTLVMIGGAETFAEDQFFYIARQAYERGYNFLTVDLPGQGLTPLSGHVFRPAMHEPLRAVVDYALSRPDVDASRLAVYGISSGGGFVPQAAQHDPRIKAVVMNACVVDAHPLVASMTPVVTATPDVVKTFTTFHGNTVKIIAWRWGLSMDNVPGLVEANRGFSFDPAKVTVPALALVGEGEYQGDETRRQQKLCLDGLPNPTKALVVAPMNEGASNHCVMENRSLVGQVVFDWLDDVFKK